MVEAQKQRLELRGYLQMDLARRALQAATPTEPFIASLGQRITAFEQTESESADEPSYTGEGGRHGEIKDAIIEGLGILAAQADTIADTSACLFVRDMLIAQ